MTPDSASTDEGYTPHHHSHLPPPCIRIKCLLSLNLPEEHNGVSLTPANCRAQLAGFALAIGCSPRVELQSQNARKRRHKADTHKEEERCPNSQ